MNLFQQVVVVGLCLAFIAIVVLNLDRWLTTGSIV